MIFDCYFHPVIILIHAWSSAAVSMQHIATASPALLTRQPPAFKMRRAVLQKRFNGDTVVIPMGICIYLGVYIYKYIFILYYIILYYIILYYYIFYYTILYYIIIYFIVVYYIVSYYIRLYDIILYYIILYYIVVYYIVSYYIILYDIIFILYDLY